MQMATGTALLTFRPEVASRRKKLLLMGLGKSTRLGCHPLCLLVGT